MIMDLYETLITALEHAVCLSKRQDQVLEAQPNVLDFDNQPLIDEFPHWHQIHRATITHRGFAP